MAIHQNKYGELMLSIDCDPAIMGIGPAGAIRRALAAAQLSLENMGLIEVNKAFAAQVRIAI